MCFDMDNFFCFSLHSLCSIYMYSKLTVDYEKEKGNRHCNLGNLSMIYVCLSQGWQYGTVRKKCRNSDSLKISYRNFVPCLKNRTVLVR